MPAVLPSFRNCSRGKITALAPYGPIRQASSDRRLTATKMRAGGRSAGRAGGRSRSNTHSVAYANSSNGPSTKNPWQLTHKT